MKKPSGKHMKGNTSKKYMGGGRVKKYGRGGNVEKNGVVYNYNSRAFGKVGSGAGTSRGGGAALRGTGFSGVK